MSRRRRLHIGLSDPQANAEALARRSATYADDNARSIELRWDRRRHRPRDLPSLVVRLRHAYADEVPSRIHVHQTDGGGTPAWSPEFAAYLTASDGATDRDNVYRTPFRSALGGMYRSADATNRLRARIVALVVLGGYGPAESALAAGVHPECIAREVAERALLTCWDRLSDTRYDLSTTAA